MGAQAICEPLKICHGRSQIIEFWVGRFGGRNFAGGRQGATPGARLGLRRLSTKNKSNVFIASNLKTVHKFPPNLEGSCSN